MSLLQIIGVTAALFVVVIALLVLSYMGDVDDQGEEASNYPTGFLQHPKYDQSNKECDE